MVKIPIFPDEANDVLYANIADNLHHYREGDCDINWIIDYLKKKEYEPVGEIEVDDITLTHDPKDRANCDAKNAIAISRAIQFQNSSLATNPSFWTIYSATKTSYLNKRWPLEEDDKKAIDTIKSRYMCRSEPAKRILGRTWLSTLWRVTNLTKQPGDRPYLLTTEAFQNTDMLQNLTDRTPFMDKNLVKTVLNYSLDRRQFGQPLRKEHYQSLGVYFNTIAGNVRIDILTTSDYSKLINAWDEWASGQPDLRFVKTINNTKNVETD